MDRDGEPWGADWLPIVLVPGFLLAIVLVLLFDVLREIPPDYGCGESPAPNLDERVASYQSGFEVLHALTLLLLAAAVAAVSVARRGRAGGRGVGKPTAAVLAAIGLAALAAVAIPDLGVLVVLLFLLAVPLLILAGGLGPQLLGLVAVAAIAWLGVWAVRAARRAGALKRVSVVCWSLLGLTAGHVLIVAEQGHGPWLC